MIQFNIIGKGFLEMDDGGLSFKQSNSFWRFAEVSLGRSVEFSVHGSRHNRALLNYGNDADEFGEMLRATYPCQMIAGAEAVFGTISVTAYDGDEFKCCFYIGNTEKLEALKNRNLSDIAIDSDPIAWATSTPVGTETADGIVALLDYEYPVPVTAWQRLPSVNAKLYAQAVLSQIGIACNGIDSDVWLVAGSINGGGEDAVTLTQTALNVASVTQTQSYFNVVDIDLKMVEIGSFGIPIGTTSTPTKGFKATQNLELTFPDPMPNDVYLIKWDNRPKRYTTIGGKPLRWWYEFHTLDGRTVTLTKGDIVFFATVPAPDYRGSLDLRGFYGSEYAVTSVAVNVKRTTELSLGENWYLQNNAPQMTVWEFLRSVALAIGKEIVVTVNPNDINDVTVDFVDSEYGVNYIRPADKVISTEIVKRRVDAWGDDTANAVIEFDSEDYVTERLRTVYEVQTTQVKGEASHVAKFSEGNIGNATMVYIKDNDDGKFSAKKWTIARRVGDELQRIEAPFPYGYDDIAVASTCVTMKVAATIEDFLSLQPQTTFLWRGLAYVWTDANWSGNVMSLTLQKVSQPSVIIPALPYDAEVEYLESTGTQFIDLGIVPDDATGVKIWLENTGSTGYVYGIADEASPSTKRIGIGVNPTGPGCVWGAQSVNSGQAFTEGVIELNFENSREFKITQGDTTYTASLSALGFTPVGTLHVFGRGGAAGVLLSKWIGRISRVKVSQGNDVIRDLVAVRVGSVGYLYDQIGGTLYANSGTGDFSVGRDLPYDAEVEYLESTGTQYIDTGILGKESIKLYARFNYPNASSAIGSGRLFGSRQTSSSNAFAVGISSGIVAANNNEMFVCYDSQPYYIIHADFNINTWHTISFDASDIELDGISYGSQYTPTPFATPQNLKLFSFDSSGVMGYGRVRVSSYKIWDGNTLLQDLIPVRVGSVGYMYDRVSGTLFGNDGTGDFIVGPDV